MQPESAEELVVLVPDHQQKTKADRERHKSCQRLFELRESLRHLERDHQQSQGKGKHRIAESIDPRHRDAAKPKPVTSNMCVQQVHWLLQAQPIASSTARPPESAPAPYAVAKLLRRHAC